MVQTLYVIERENTLGDGFTSHIFTNKNDAMDKLDDIEQQGIKAMLVKEEAPVTVRGQTRFDVKTRKNLDVLAKTNDLVSDM